MIIVGFLVGLLATFFYPWAVEMDLWQTTVMGIAGSLVGGIIKSVFWESPDGRFRFRLGGWILSIIGAVIVIWTYSHLMSLLGHG